MHPEIAAAVPPGRAAPCRGPRPGECAIPDGGCKRINSEPSKGSEPPAMSSARPSRAALTRSTLRARDQRLEPRARDGADDLADDAAVAEDHHGGHGAHVELHGELGV